MNRLLDLFCLWSYTWYEPNYFIFYPLVELLADMHVDSELYWEWGFKIFIPETVFSDGCHKVWLLVSIFHVFSHLRKYIPHPHHTGPCAILPHLLERQLLYIVYNLVCIRNLKTQFCETHNHTEILTCPHNRGQFSTLKARWQPSFQKERNCFFELHTHYRCTQM